MRLRALEQLLESRGIFEPLLERFRPFLGVAQWLAVEPLALLVRRQELAQAFDLAGPYCSDARRSWSRESR